VAAAGPSARPLWRDRNFGIFWAAQTLSVAGDSFAYIAIPLLVLHATGSVAQMGLLTGIGGAASVGAGIFAGVLADRLDRRTLLICCDLARMVLYGIIPLAWSFGPEVWLLYVVLPACEAIGMVFQVTYVTAVRNLTGGDRVTEANGLLYATATAAGVLGPLLAGLVSGAFGATAAIAIDAASFALSAAGAAAIRLGGQRGPGPAARRRPWTELLAGAGFLWRQPVLRALTMALTFFIFLTYGLTDVLIYHLRHDLGQSYAAIGVVLAIAAAGPVAGSALVARLRRVIGFGACWIGGVAVSGIAIACLGASGSVPAIAALAAVYLGCSSVAGICSMSLRQQVTPDHLLGRVTSAFWTAHFSLGPVGAAVLAWAAGRYGAGPVCVASGGGCLLIAGATLFTPIRQPAPELA
jgi:MFS family permease